MTAFALALDIPVHAQERNFGLSGKIQKRRMDATVLAGPQAGQW
ncbi:MAG TPA: hypothetical protein VMB25_15890 [Bryobacteraceae bacterium]|nr:hypothetical protein [Bryobacteraceae bacterium]